MKSVLDIDVTDNRNLYKPFRLSDSDVAHRSSFNFEFNATHVVFDEFGLEHEFASEEDAEAWIENNRK